MIDFNASTAGSPDQFFSFAYCKRLVDKKCECLNVIRHDASKIVFVKFFAISLKVGRVSDRM